MKWSFRIFVVLVGLLLIAGGVMVLRPKPLDVEVGIAQKAPLAQKVVDEGHARVRERYTVSAPVAGTLSRVELNEGDAVEPKTVVARILPSPSPLLDPRSRDVAEQRLGSAVDLQKQAAASVTRAETAADQAKKDLARIEALVKAGSLAGTSLDQATADSRMRDAELASARFASKVAEHEIAQARAALERYTPGAKAAEQFEVTSPIHGQVLHVLHKSEGAVAPGAALVELGDPEAIELVVDVLSQDAVSIRPGMVADVVHWGGDHPLTAKVRRVEPAAFTRTSALGVDEQRVNVILDLDGAPTTWRPLGDGFSVDVEITVWSKPDVLQVPTSALFRSGSDWALFAVDKGKARLAVVKPGHWGPLSTEIISGVGAGAVVIVHPGSAVRDGVAVAHR